MNEGTVGIPMSYVVNALYLLGAVGLLAALILAARFGAFRKLAGWWRARPASAGGGLVGGFKSLSRPTIGLIAIAFFLGFGTTAAVRVDLLDQSVHLVGTMLVVLAALFTLIAACYFLFDAWLSFAEFSKRVNGWFTGKWVPTSTDATIMLAMAIRSGLVFLGFCIVAYGGLAYLDF